MVEVVYHGDFLRSAEKLPTPQQRKLDALLSLLRKNPYHPLLHTKYLSGQLIGQHSFRITRDWRVTFRFLAPHIIQLLRVKHRKDIYQ